MSHFSQCTSFPHRPSAHNTLRCSSGMRKSYANMNLWGFLCSKSYVTSFYVSVWQCAIAFVDDLLLGSKIMQHHLQCMSPIINRVISPVVVCMSRVFFRYLWFMLLLKYEGPRTVQSGWNFNPAASTFLENVPNIFLHWAAIINPAQFQEAIFDT